MGRNGGNGEDEVGRMRRMSWEEWGGMGRNVEEWGGMGRGFELEHSVSLYSQFTDTRARRREETQ